MFRVTTYRCKIIPASGKVLSWNTRGFGKVLCTETNETCFVNTQGICAWTKVKDLTVGASVEFDKVDGFPGNGCDGMPTCTFLVQLAREYGDPEGPPDAPTGNGQPMPRASFVHWREEERGSK